MLHRRSLPRVCNICFCISELRQGRQGRRPPALLLMTGLVQGRSRNYNAARWLLLVLRALRRESRLLPGVNPERFEATLWNGPPAAWRAGLY
jgi:hypothetical protein